MHAGGIALVREYLLALPLDGYDAFAPGPYTLQRAAMEKASTSPFIQFLQDELLECRDIWTATELCAAYQTITGRRMGTEIMGHQLRKAKCPPSRLVKADGRVVKLTTIRNHTAWVEKENKEWVEEWCKKV
jgi:hypothetical protein